MKPLLVFCFLDLECPLRTILGEALRIGLQSGDGNGREPGGLESSSGGDGRGEAGFPLAARLLYTTCSGEGESELWIRASGRPEYVKALDQAAGRSAGVRYQVVFQTRFNRIMRLVWSKNRCGARSECPLANRFPGVMVKSVIVLPETVLFELIVAKSSSLKSLEAIGCEFVRVHEISEMDYMLTEKQETALIHAYLAGYYQFPRNISLKDLAASMGLSASSLAELLRKAEIKVIEAFIRHELPHYMVYAVLKKRKRRGVVEAGPRARAEVNKG